MFFQESSFRTMESGLNAAWMQQQIHTQNLSNYETPGYKAKSIVFNESLHHAKSAYGPRNAGALKARIIDNETTSIRPDGNNVDADEESLSLYKAYAHYSMLLDKLRSEINNYNYVMANGPK